MYLVNVEQVNKMQAEIELLREKYHKAQQQSSESNMKLNVLTEYFKQKELEMQR